MTKALNLAWVYHKANRLNPVLHPKYKFLSVLCQTTTASLRGQCGLANMIKYRPKMTNNGS